MKKIICLLFTAGILAGSTLQASFTDAFTKSNESSSTAKEIILDDVVAMDALQEFKSLSRVDRKMRMTEAKTKLKEFKAQKQAGSDPSTNTILLAILAILLPPLAVYLHEGTINGKFWLSILLTLLFWIPGVIYALIVVL